ncbi:MAG: nucleotidyl transferase AbiEii/AbiGii toxin family protein [Legionellales bacterium]|jgi:predicted nucleotidyltransferase component of viral defense system
MIPTPNIIAWGNIVPWVEPDLIEHDLILSRALCELYTNPIINKNLVFRGGTALHKLFFKEAGRFSEDLDFVQASPVPIGETIDAVHSVLDPWLGKPNHKQNAGRFTLYYKFTTENAMATRKLKLEINTREHYRVSPLNTISFKISNPWFTGNAEILTHPIEEIMATKLRALYQRSKGRDLYDFWYVLEHIPELDVAETIRVFDHYMQKGKTPVTRAQFEQNLMAKKNDIVFNADIIPLLSLKQNQTYSAQSAYGIIFNRFLPKLKGATWKGLKD